MSDIAAGRLLRQARHRARVSQASMAALLGTSQTKVSRWESGNLALLDHELDDALAICGAQRSGPRSLSDLLTPLAGHESLSWFAFQTPLDRLRITARHCAAAGAPLAGASWPALLGALKLITGMPECAVSGAVGRALRSPDRSGDRDIDHLDIRADATSAVWSLPARLPALPIRVTRRDPDEHPWTSWPMPTSWPGPLMVAYAGVGGTDDVPPTADLGRSDP